MRLIRLDTPELIALVARWLAEKENFRWFDFAAREQMTPAIVKFMALRDTSVLRVFTADDDETPVGIVGLTNIDRHFKTATIWVVRGNKAYGGGLLPSRALSKMLTFGFHELGLGAINTWTVAHNRSSVLARRLKFRYVGRQRRCHYIDGQPCDRLLFDILPSEHTELRDGRGSDR